MKNCLRANFPPLALLCLMLISLSAGPVRADWSNPTDAALAGWVSYGNGGADAAAKKWQLQDAISNPAHPAHEGFRRLVALEDTYGRRVRVELIRELTISASARSFYYSLIFQRGLSFARVDVFRDLSGDWNVSHLRLSADVEEVLPPEVLHRPTPAASEPDR